jgi:hypothetical protein
MRRPWPTRGCCTIGKKKKEFHQMRCFPLPEDGSRAGFRNAVFYYNEDDEQRQKKEDCFTKPYIIVRAL